MDTLHTNWAYMVLMGLGQNLKSWSAFVLAPSDRPNDTVPNAEAFGFDVRVSHVRGVVGACPGSSRSHRPWRGGSFVGLESAPESVVGFV
ncbi:MAG: hypothetical protein ACFCD0_02430 [Gemmataceae bacterium]